MAHIHSSIIVLEKEMTWKDELISSPPLYSCSRQGSFLSFTICWINANNCPEVWTDAKQIIPTGLIIRCIIQAFMFPLQYRTNVHRLTRVQFLLEVTGSDVSRPVYVVILWSIISIIFQPGICPVSSHHPSDNVVISDKYRRMNITI